MTPLIRPPNRRRLLLGAGASLIGLPGRATAQDRAAYEKIRDEALSGVPATSPIPPMKVSIGGWTIGSTTLSEVVVELPAPRLTPGRGVVFDPEGKAVQAAIVLERGKTLLRINVPRFVMDNDIRTSEDKEDLDLRFRVRGQFVADGTFRDSTPVRIVGSFRNPQRTLARLRQSGQWEFTCDVAGKRAYTVSGSLDGSDRALRFAADEIALRLDAADRGHKAAAAPSGAVGCPFTLVALLAGEQDDGPTLTALRWARSRVLIARPDGRALLHRYVTVGPAAVRAMIAVPDLLRDMQGMHVPAVLNHLAAGRCDAGIAACHGMLDVLSTAARRA